MEWFLRIWIPLAIVVTGMCLLVYATVQHAYRQTLYDPQIQLVRDAARALSGGAKPAIVVGTGTPVDIEASLRPYVAIYDEEMQPVAWSGEIDAKPPQPPTSVFDGTKDLAGTEPGENRMAWQVTEEVRSALVIEHVVGGPGGYVVAGRGMREFEDRLWDMQLLVATAWISIMMLSLMATWYGARVAAGKTGVVW